MPATVTVAATCTTTSTPTSSTSTSATTTASGSKSHGHRDGDDLQSSESYCYDRAFCKMACAFMPGHFPHYAEDAFKCVAFLNQFPGKGK